MEGRRRALLAVMVGGIVAAVCCFMLAQISAGGVMQTSLLTMWHAHNKGLDRESASALWAQKDLTNRLKARIVGLKAQQRAMLPKSQQAMRPNLQSVQNASEDSEDDDDYGEVCTKPQQNAC
jgi:hypothetical protein